jgi:hypothetical protein
MNSNEVISLLGVPLRVDAQTASEQWLYYPAGMLPTETGITRVLNTGSALVPSGAISFDDYGKVIHQFGLTNDFDGKYRDFVLKSLGRPHLVKSNVSSSILNYTLGRYSGSHEVRAVILGENGTVISIQAFYYRD